MNAQPAGCRQRKQHNYKSAKVTISVLLKMPATVIFADAPTR